MKRLWSPWRSQHLETWEQRKPGAAAAPSLFTRLLAENEDEKNLILWRGELVFVIMNLYPYNNGHLMIVPYREVAAYEDLTPAEQAALAETLGRCIRWLNHALRPDGYNVGMNLGEAAGAGLPQHLHLHVVPRWRADTNFMPTIADVKVIPEALHDTYRKLRQAIEALERG
ncbi:MAG: hydrolase [Rhodothermaceae bacterium]|nr:MAG: hydrolase [Rhodothermaceae bacterium]